MPLTLLAADRHHGIRELQIPGRAGNLERCKRDLCLDARMRHAARDSSEGRLQRRRPPGRFPHAVDCVGVAHGSRL